MRVQLIVPCRVSSMAFSEEIRNIFMCYILFFKKNIVLILSITHAKLSMLTF